MCFHYSMSEVAKNLENRYHAPSAQNYGFEPVHHANGFSFPVMPVVTAHEGHQIEFFTWGLIPGWTTNLSDAGKLRAMTLNARAETVFEKPSFRKAVLWRRCLVPTNGFYEWQTVGNKKIPWFIRIKENEIFSFGGIWERWENPEGGTWNTYSILTVEANTMLSEIHNSKMRMPLIIPARQEDRWLDHSTRGEEIARLMVPYPEEEMEAWTISPLITRRGADTNSAAVKEPYVWAGIPPVWKTS